MMRDFPFLPPVVLLACLIGGCGRAAKTKVDYNLALKSGNPVMTVGKLTVMFEGIQMKGEDAELSKGFFFVPHPGTTATGGTSTVNELKIKEDPGKDDNTISLDGYSFKLIEKGTKLAFGDQVFPIEGSAQTIVVGKAGNAKAKK